MLEGVPGFREIALQVMGIAEVIITFCADLAIFPGGGFEMLDGDSVLFAVKGSKSFL